MVDGGDQGHAATGDSQHAVAEGLVVVDDVEVVEPVPERPIGAEAEGQRFGEAGGVHGRDLEQVDGVADLAGPRSAERIRLAVEVEAGQFGESDAGIEFRVGLPREHLHLVAECDQFPGQVPDVHALATAVGLAAV